MAEIRVKENESLDSALRRFKRQCQRSGVLTELKKREQYDKPSVKRKKKSEAARKRKFKYFVCYFMPKNNGMSQTTSRFVFIKNYDALKAS